MTVWACARPKHSRSRTEAHRDMDFVKLMVRYNSDGVKLQELNPTKIIRLLLDQSWTQFIRSLDQ